MFCQKYYDISKIFVYRFIYVCERCNEEFNFNLDTTLESKLNSYQKQEFDNSLFLSLYYAGATVDDMKHFFGVKRKKITNRKHYLKLEPRRIPCKHCGHYFETSNIGKYSCDRCTNLIQERYKLKRIILSKCITYQDTQRIKQQMIEEEGEEFAHFVFDG